ncbi:DUF6443 domain-containing protein [Chryseobacterium sp. MYb264]|uniref:DUF6443 domain-containing protein n=1 Tax=Chryseobacterium sp. MYb264 TaxID=2745153 RepID=UPI002E15A2AB|nr:DUF6443 domain-containing protein [Chryseobacterium sp. MYb264]
MKKILIPISALLISGFAEAQVSQTENYVSSKTYLDYNGTTPSKTAETVQYFDGLGRPKQVVNVKASPLGRDVVTPIEYDGFGRQVKDYLPIPQGNTLNGAMVPTPLGNSSTIYGGEKIYAEKVLENSPLDRIQQQLQVGNDWSTKPVKFDYEANAAGEVKKYVATFNYTTFTSSITLSGSYGAAQLYKNTVTDEDGNKTIEFKNGQGQTLLVRKINGTENVDTYYVYNDYNQLAYVISPLAAVSGATDEATLNNLCYQYKYDGRNRLVEKKLPGKGWEYMVYDKQDRLVLTQDANLREKNQWLFTKYDQFSRPVYTGISYSASGRIQHVAAVESFGSANESRTSASWNSNGIDVYYTKSGAYPNQSNFTILTVNYYDAYFTGDPFPSKVWNQDVLPSSPQQYDRSTKGLPVIKLVKNIEDDGWTKTYFYYDLKGRPIREYIFNHLGGYTNVERQLDFSGNIQIVSTQHKRLATDAEKLIIESFEYDHQNRLLVHKHKVDSQPEEILAQNKYNELSQLENKKVGGTNAASPLQSIDYAYNIRGWMTAINPNQMTVPDLGGKLFSYKIKYNHKEGISYPNPVFAALEVKPKYNGNITEVDWRSVGNIGNNPSITPKRYGYVYDGLNRLMAGYYQNPNNAYSGENIESLLYDLNGNITSLYRTSVVENTNSITPTTIDNLAYSYIGNRVNTITDSSNNPTGYEGGGQTITYDLNGNMKSMPDKQITAISYNYLNLPNSIVLQGFRSNTHHLYNANGIKLHKRIMETNDGINGSVFTTVDTDYLDGFQYVHKEESGSGSPGDGGTPIGGELIEALSSPLRRAMEVQAFSPEAKNILSPSSSSDLQFFPTAEGFYDYQKKQYIYQYKDHLGNVRVSFGKNTQSQALEITDMNDYYPFGMNHLKTGTAMFGQSSYKNYKYNGKELQETGMYDYGARLYMSDIGRWGVLDNYSENYFPTSPYSYVANNPIKFIDVNGEWIYINDQDGTQYRYHNGATQHQVDGKWANVDASTKLSDYVLQTVSGLNHLDKSTSIGNTMIGYFDQAQGKDGKMRDINFDYTTGGSKIKHGISNIVELNISSSDGSWTTSGKDIKYSPLYTTIAHEMGHVYGYFALGERATSDTRFGPHATTAEIYGSHVENIVRSETGLPLRTHYRSNKDGTGYAYPGNGSRLIDNAGSSIYYNSDGTQISPIPSNKDVLNVNNTILQNKYNYHGAAAYYHWKRFKTRGQ